MLHTAFRLSSKFVGGKVKVSKLSSSLYSAAANFGEISIIEKGRFVQIAVSEAVKQRICKKASEMGFNDCDISELIYVPKILTLASPWLLDNCVSRRHSTGQRESNLISELPPNEDQLYPQFQPHQPPSIQSASFVLSCTSTNCNEEVLKVNFDKNSDAPSVNIPTSAIVKYVLNKLVRVPVPPPRIHASHVYRVNFKDFTSHIGSKDESLLKRGTVAHYTALKRLAFDGIIILEGCGVGEEVVPTVAEALGGVMPTLYGLSWHVKVTPTEGPKNNVAYSTARLGLHQDLAYHESMPGVQMLHCQRFNNTVKGGESTFLDSFEVARMMKKQFPHDFELLTRLPSAYMKDDMDRPVPAQYYYATPHIHVNDRGGIIKMFWSPAFEAPLPLQGTDAEAYYNARGSFVKVLREACAKKLIKFHLKEGETVVFQQQRVWHGRESFVEKQMSSRVLHGGYVNLEVFRNTVMYRSVLHNDEDTQFFLSNFENRSWR